MANRGARRGDSPSEPEGWPRAMPCAWGARVRRLAPDSRLLLRRWLGADWLPSGYERLFEPQHTAAHASTIARWLTGYERLNCRFSSTQPPRTPLQTR